MRKLFAVLLAVIMVLSMAACAKEEPQPTMAATEAATEVPETQAAEPVPETAAIRVMVLNGTTGFGMANLMDAAAKEEADAKIQYLKTQLERSEREKDIMWNEITRKSRIIDGLIEKLSQG